MVVKRSERHCLIQNTWQSLVLVKSFLLESKNGQRSWLKNYSPAKDRRTGDRKGCKPYNKYHEESKSLWASPAWVVQRLCNSQIAVHTNSAQTQDGGCAQQDVQWYPDVAEHPTQLPWACAHSTVTVTCLQYKMNSYQRNQTCCFMSWTYFWRIFFFSSIPCIKIMDKRNIAHTHLDVLSNKA